jgi:uncharacterized damage-inducible protein DinB
MSSLPFFKNLVAQEKGVFSRVAGAVLEEGLDYRPDPKARSSRELLEHLIGHNLDIVELMQDGVIHHRNQVPIESAEDGVRQLDASFDAAVRALDSIGDEEWGQTGTFMLGEEVIMTGPYEQIAWMMFLDAVHHRGQLSTHLRPMGSRVPAMYGPSADDPGGDAH